MVDRRTAPLIVGAISGAIVLGGWKGTAEAAPAKPHGESQIRATFGAPCNSQAYGHATTWPYGAWNGGGGPSTLSGHSLLAEQWNGARWWTANTSGSDQKLNYGIGGYNCRAKTGSPDAYSTHAWGIAVDTNTLCNPQGQSYWNGRGYNGPGNCDGPDYGTALPDIWKANNAYSYVNFTWGLSWNDPHHFQYADGY